MRGSKRQRKKNARGTRRQRRKLQRTLQRTWPLFPWGEVLSLSPIHVDWARIELYQVKKDKDAP